MAQPKQASSSDVKRAEVKYWKELILEMREMGCNKVADLLVDELDKVRGAHE